MATQQQKNNIDTEALKELLKDVVKEGGSSIELISVSPTNSNIIAYTAEKVNYDGWGIYLYNKATKENKKIYFLEEPLTGRGGYYPDNLALEFAPEGKAFYVNKTGTNVPSLFILDNQGNILYQGDGDNGNPAWLNRDELIFISSNQNVPVTFNIKTKQKSQTNLPNAIYHLKSNSNGSSILAIKISKESGKCGDRLDLYAFSYPEGKELRLIKDIEYTTYQWKTINTFTYQSVDRCKDQEGYPIPIPSEPKEERLNL